jgi:hypothetical protein
MQVTTRASSDVHKRAWLRPIIGVVSGHRVERERRAVRRRAPASALALAS